ncbi:MAG TPA: hypothetical protein PKC21_07360 [Oligoflexia bacterium]|nr:hypothetical protein [Oligoflexia bacterium]HMR25154.1 hypothetical protein [Oligoflexia bacterium]
MKIYVVQYCIILFLSASLCLFAQDDESPPPLNPYDSPWGEPVTPPSNSNGAPSNNNTNSSDDDFGDQDDFDAPFTPPSFGGNSSSSSGQSGEGKSSFMLVEESNVDQCKNWGNQLLSNKSFTDFNDCQFNLERKLEETHSAIEHSIDTIERFKLKKMLRGQIKNEDRKKNQLDYSKLEARLKAENKKGCICIKK